METREIECNKCNDNGYYPSDNPEIKGVDGLPLWHAICECREGAHAYENMLKNATVLRITYDEEPNK